MRAACRRWVLEGRADVPVDSVEAALGLIAQGDACKRKAATAMNERSSRAHALFILTVTQVEAASGVEHTSRLFLADLGGSEKLSKSQAGDGAKSNMHTPTHVHPLMRMARVRRRETTSSRSS